MAATEPSAADLRTLRRVDRVTKRECVIVPSPWWRPCCARVRTVVPPDEADQKGQVRSWTPADGTCAASRMNPKGAFDAPEWQLRKKSTSISRLPSIIARRAYVYFDRGADQRPSRLPATRGRALPLRSPSCQKCTILTSACLCLRPAPQQQFEFFLPPNKLGQSARVCKASKRLY
jgi:hypothetical protein